MTRLRSALFVLLVLPACTARNPAHLVGGGAGQGTAITGAVGPNGGRVSRLSFTVIGDTRPATRDDTQGYPTGIVDQLYADIAAMSPQPLFTVSTGDYVFASPGSGQAGPQMELYLLARSQFPGPLFPAMGNHECTGATASNCGDGNADGLTDNFTGFLSLLLGPIEQPRPYYSIEIDDVNGAWTSKLVFIAANAWDEGQASWLENVMAQPTTYTFVVRHEPSRASSAPGVVPSDRVLRGSSYTLLIEGHTHDYERIGANEVVIGNGGAPLTGSGSYGYGVFAQADDGSIAVDMVDYQSNQPDPSFHFAVQPDGTPAP